MDGKNGTYFENYSDYTDWFYEYLGQKINEVTSKYSNLNLEEGEALNFLRTDGIWPRSVPQPSKMSFSIFDENGAMMGHTKDVREFTKEEGAKILDNALGDVLETLDVAAKCKEQDPLLSLSTAYQTYTEIEKYKADEVKKEYNWNKVDVNNSSVGKIVTGNDWGFAPLNTMFNEITDEFDKYSDEDKEKIVNADWDAYFNELDMNTQKILDDCSNFYSEFENIDSDLDFTSEFKKTMSQCIDISKKDLQTLSTFIKDNLNDNNNHSVKYFINEMKENIKKHKEITEDIKTKEDELNKKTDELLAKKEELNQKKDILNSNTEELNKKKEQQKTDSSITNDDISSLQDKGYELSSEIQKLSRTISELDQEIGDIKVELDKLRKDLETVRESFKICKANIEVYNAVVIKYNESSHWQYYQKSKETNNAPVTTNFFVNTGGQTSL